eukprot:GILK01008418.1.p1 GENE.GILK01008418.1~~GILK01008418.1.p1  ORF type:complete len:231 (-),score=42.59 GILK01008418.1:87-779(-)
MTTIRISFVLLFIAVTQCAVWSLPANEQAIRTHLEGSASTWKEYGMKTDISSNIDEVKMPQEDIAEMQHNVQQQESMHMIQRLDAAVAQHEAVTHVVPVLETLNVFDEVPKKMSEGDQALYLLFGLVAVCCCIVAYIIAALVVARRQNQTSRLARVMRPLFKIDAKELDEWRQSVQSEQKAVVVGATLKWNFDFEAGRPVRGAQDDGLQWMPVRRRSSEKGPYSVSSSVF